MSENTATVQSLPVNTSVISSFLCSASVQEVDDTAVVTAVAWARAQERKLAVYHIWAEYRRCCTEDIVRI